MASSPFSPLKHLGIALGLLGLGICAVEFALHVYAAYAPNGVAELERRGWTPSWTVHHSLKPDSHVSTVNPDDGTTVEWNTNSRGIRAPELQVPKPAGVFRIVCVGNESTLAPETPSEAAFCGRLGEMLKPVAGTPVEVINAGCPQYGPLLSYLALRHSLLSLGPDLVICNFDMADIANDHCCRRSVRMNGRQPLYCPHPELERQRGAAEKAWVERLEMWRHGRRSIGYLLGNEPQTDDKRDIDSPRGSSAWIRDDSPDWSLYIEQTLEVINEIDVLCRQARCQFLLAAVPAPWQISAEASGGAGVRAAAGLDDHVRYASRTPFETLAAFSRKSGILYCDASIVFARVPGPERLFLNNAPRFSAAGHELYARIVGRFLVQNVDGPWLSDRSGKIRRPPRLSKRGGPGGEARPAGLQKGDPETSVQQLAGSGGGNVEQAPAERGAGAGAARKAPRLQRSAQLESPSSSGGGKDTR